MKLKDSDNKLAHFLDEQGNYVINVAGVDWYDYSGFMIPAYLPPCCPVITEELAVEVIRKSGRPFVRWDSGFGKVKSSEWWYVLKKGPWAIENVKDKKKRWMIRQGQKGFSVRPLTFNEVVSKCPRVAELAAARYKGKTRVETRQSLERQIEAAGKVPGILEYIGCFYEDTLASFSENYIQDNVVWLATIRHDPAYLNRYLSYGFLDGILDYYLNQKKFLYVLDGCRNIHHRTDFQEHLIKVFGFTKEYALLNVVYRPGFALGVKAAYPFRSVIWGLNRILINSTLDKVSGVLRQEYITKACKRTNRKMDFRLNTKTRIKCDALVGYSWCRSSYAAIRSLSRLGLRVAAADTSRFGMGQWSRYISARYLHTDPQTAPEKFIDNLADILKQCGAHFYLTGHDEGEVVAKYRDRLPRHVILPLADYQLLSLANDKLRMTQIASSIGVPTPRFTQIKKINKAGSALAEVGGTGVIKLLRGCGAKGVYYPADAQQAEAITQKLIEKHGLAPERYPMIEERVEGEGWGVSCLYWQGMRIASFTHRRLREKIITGGTSTLRESAHNPVLEGHAHHLLDHLVWHGLAMVEFKWDPQLKKAWFLEINPRLWGSIALPIACGVDFPAMAYVCATQGVEAARKMCRDYPQGVVARWYLGDLILSFNLLAKGRFRNALRAMWPGGANVYDDLLWDDLTATLGEFVSYFFRFVKSGSTNPQDRGALG